MSSVYRLHRGLLVTAGLAGLLAGLTGCKSQGSSEPIRYTPASKAGLSLADPGVALPANVRLPIGFHPLAGHYDPANSDTHVNGWPRYIVCDADDMIMVYVPAQTILMGGGTGPDAVPARQVYINHYYIDLHEASNAQFGKFLGQVAGRRKVALSSLQEELMQYVGQNPGGAFRQFWTVGLNDHHPARNVSWWEAYFYAQWAGKSLPSEAEWEAAARGDDGRFYPWGNDSFGQTTRYLCNAAGSRGGYDGYEYTAPVLNYAAGVSPFGAFQMAGNVAEWCDDWYDPSRYAYPSQEDPPAALERGLRPFGDANYPNPIDKVVLNSRVGPIRGDQRVIRGGSFAEPIEACRVDARRTAQPDSRMPDVGFRCVLVLAPEQMTAQADQ